MCHNQSLKNFWFPNLLLCITLLVFNNSAKNTQIQIQENKMLQNDTDSIFNSITKRNMLH